jgi:nucleotide-binding universal stress UspA family protein
MKTIKNIIVATDFSDASRAAYEYTRHLAGRLGANIRLVHVYNIPTVPTNPNFMDYVPSIDGLQEVAEARLKHFAHDEDHEDHGDTIVVSRVKVQCEAYPSFATDKLIELSFDPSVDLLVMGATGERSLLDKLVGSVATKVAQEANCPVLLIPRSVDFRGVHHIVYSSSTDSASLQTVRTTLDLAKQFAAAVHFVHVKLPEDLFNDHASEMLFTQIVEKEHPTITYSISNISALTVKDGLYAYTSRNYTDMLVLVTRHRNFWQSFMHNSTTADMAWMAELPLLILHSDEKHHPPV